GHRFNPAKLLLDPYARATTAPALWQPQLMGYRRTDPYQLASLLDSAAVVPKAVVISGPFDWGDDRPPRTPWRDTVILETHVKGFTRLCPDLDPSQRGTYAGLAEPRPVQHLLDLGVTAVELL